MPASSPNSLNSGFTLLECMAVISLIAVFLLFAGHFSSSIFASYQARNEVYASAQLLMLDAQHIRTLARTHKSTISIMPKCNNSWESGWIAFHNPGMLFDSRDITKIILQKEITPQVTTQRPRGSQAVSGTQFSDVSIKSYSHPRCIKPNIPNETHEKLRHISFNSLGAAQTKNGGFVANRIVFWSKLYPNIEYQLIMGDGGRLRLCKPEAINPQCKL